MKKPKGVERAAIEILKGAGRFLGVQDPTPAKGYNKRVAFVRSAGNGRFVLITPPKAPRRGGEVTFDKLAVRSLGTKGLGADVVAGSPPEA